MWSTVFAGIPVHIADKAKIDLWAIYRKYGTFLKTLDQINHVVEYNFQLLSSLGIPLAPHILMSLPVPDDNRLAAATTLNALGRRPDLDQCSPER